MPLRRILSVVGARPQFIKAAAVSRALAAAPDLCEVMVHTGQHHDQAMSGAFFAELEIPAPAWNLGIHGGSHAAMTGRMLQALERVMLAEKPHAVLVYGDTNSTLAAALAAAKLHCPVIHVEAGLRSHNMRMPEEINRVVTDRLATLLCTPTETATRNLLAEGVSEERILQCGDVMYDAARFFAHKAAASPVLQELGLTPGGYVLATVHRQENTDDAALLAGIMRSLAEVARELPVVLPLHPRTRARLTEQGALGLLQELVVTAPQGYTAMTRLVMDAVVVATDSGGLQKEAFFHKTPCVTLRQETEWVELLELGWNRLAPPGGADLAQQILEAAGTQGAEATPYGEGRAAEAVVEAVVEWTE